MRCITCNSNTNMDVEFRIMSNDLVKRLRLGIVEYRKRWSGDTHGDLGGSVDYDATTDMLFDAADRIEELEATLAKLKGETDE